MIPVSRGFLLTACGLFIAAASPAQEVPLVLDRVIELPTRCDGQWDIAAKSDGGYAISYQQGSMLYYLPDLDANWVSNSIASTFSGLCYFRSDSLRACVHGWLDAELLSPETGKTLDTLLLLANYHYEGSCGGGAYMYDEQNYIKRIDFFPPSPSRSEDAIIYGTTTVQDYCQCYDPPYSQCNRSCITIVNRVNRVTADHDSYSAYLQASCSGLDVTHELEAAFVSGSNYKVGFADWYQDVHGMPQYFDIGYQTPTGNGIPPATTFYTCSTQVYHAPPPDLQARMRGIRWIQAGSNGQQTLVTIPRYVLPAHADSIFVGVPGQPGLRSILAGQYSEVFGADVVPDAPGEEILALRSDENRFNIYRSDNFMFWGMTSLFDGNVNDMKLIASRNDNARRLVLSDSTQIRIYRFEAPETTNPNSDASALPLDIHITANPNPASQVVQFTVSKSLRTQSEIRVFNILGQEVAREPLKEFSTSLTMPISQLPSGIYFARVNTVNSKPYKFVIMR